MHKNKVYLEGAPKVDRQMEKLDELDYSILRMLIQDAKTPYTEVGKLLKVSSGTIHVRMRKMEHAGVVTGSTLAINHEELGFQMDAFLGIDLVRDELLDEVITRLKEIPQILTAYYTSGPHPILARIVCIDKKELSDILRTQVYTISGIQSVEAYITLSEYFNRSVQIHTAAE